ncbi:MAG: DUF255 domain-containing protein [Candidatus Omnitrophica bacterium]|nr:DUF255 domain-containing protein [Candidatus Omnitrophota bacterium]
MKGREYFTQNNLNHARSTYLRQHKENPIWWQEWNRDTLRYAREQGKMLFVSSGYSTCHWCHVMAREAFSDRDIANVLNEHCVSIKVDREQRPDIDQYLMQYLAEITGSGGWPLNAWLTPGLNPVFACTYLPAKARSIYPGFAEIVRRVLTIYREKGEELPEFMLAAERRAGKRKLNITESILQGFDVQYGGFGNRQKFPPHSTLLFMLYFIPVEEDESLKVMVEHTLEVIGTQGLCDHLQGGFFRYCVDRQWRVPHFEKMLYDQGYLLWIYSLAFRIFRREEYRKTAEKLAGCLDAVFRKGSTYRGGFDADTGGEEGGTYLWSRQELEEVLGEEKFREFTDLYEVPPAEVPGKRFHLRKKYYGFFEDVERTLLAVRERRRQPEADENCITAWNCVAAIGLIHAFRYLGDVRYLRRAEEVFEALREGMVRDGGVVRGQYEGEALPYKFLEDSAALLLLTTYLHEETGKYEQTMRRHRTGLFAFREQDAWREARALDFVPVSAHTADHSVPSSVSLAELALARVSVLLGEPLNPENFSEPLLNDFHNIAVMMKNGMFHLFETPQKIAWPEFPVNGMQKKGDQVQDCYKGICRSGPNTNGA